MNKFAGFVMFLVAVAVLVGGCYLGAWHLFVLSVADMIDSAKTPGTTDGMRVAIDLLCMVIAYPCIQVSVILSMFIGAFGVKLCNE